MPWFYQSSVKTVLMIYIVPSLPQRLPVHLLSTTTLLLPNSHKPSCLAPTSGVQPRLLIVSQKSSEVPLSAAVPVLLARLLQNI